MTKNNQIDSQDRDEDEILTAPAVDDGASGLESDELPQPQQNVKSVDEHIFQERINQIMHDAESFRLYKMGLHQGREFVSLTVTLAATVIGGSGFAWFFLMEGNLLLALLSMLVAVVPHIVLSRWVNAPVTKYKNDYKTRFMPRVAEALGGLEYFPKRGISRKVLARTGIVPAHDVYKAEDCFAGCYRGAKITLSEARLSRNNNKGQYTFDGLFVLIELPFEIFKGHSVLTADYALAKRLMKRLTQFPVTSERFVKLFTLLSSDAGNAQTLNSERLLSELHEAMLIFGKAPLSAAFFAQKYIFIQIPHAEDMFEPSDLNVPITTSDTMLKCKKEISQLLSLIDIVDVLKGKGAA
ncbi:MAG: DUF3137 domain-containing protein [Alphaproteobacteria bacterium]